MAHPQSAAYAEVPHKGEWCWTPCYVTVKSFAPHHNGDAEQRVQSPITSHPENIEVVPIMGYSAGQRVNARRLAPQNWDSHAAMQAAGWNVMGGAPSVGAVRMS